MFLPAFSFIIFSKESTPKEILSQKLSSRPRPAKREVSRDPERIEVFAYSGIRISSTLSGLVWNDGFEVSGHSLKGLGLHLFPKRVLSIGNNGFLISNAKARKRG
jgi:hypothetical protein